MIRLWCEYDYGQEDFVFTDQATAKNWLNNAVDWYDFDDDVNIETWENNGLFGYEVVTLIS